ncbi:MAG: hypothetical protein D6717_10710 [Gammaproteobacteria bacterium]|nr:MAG: hypothetical protein D6717_10710 [Gammaproteobacteria bacterium]
MCRLCWIVLGLVLVLAGLGTWKFVVQGDTEAASDGRTAILLPPAERDLVLSEMRAFLEAVQQISAALPEGDMKKAAAAARRLGAAAQQGVPPSLVARLPLAFKRLGFDTHRRFDQLAMNAEQFGDPTQTGRELATLMDNCIACHAAYRIDPVTRP